MSLEKVIFAFFIDIQNMDGLPVCTAIGGAVSEM